MQNVLVFGSLVVVFVKKKRIYIRSAITISLSEEQLTEIIKAYRTIQEFLGTIVSPNELYQPAFFEGLKESDNDIHTKAMNEVRSFEDFVD